MITMYNMISKTKRWFGDNALPYLYNEYMLVLLIAGSILMYEPVKWVMLNLWCSIYGFLYY